LFIHVLSSHLCQGLSHWPIISANDKCKPQPCKNGGVCKTEGGSYKCECTIEYEGVNCETLSKKGKFSECLSEEPLHGLSWKI
jgi:hypothetical protein